MSPYVLDTDQISLQQCGVEPLFSRVNALPRGSFVITAVSIEETFRGRLAQIKQARKEEDLIVAYRWLIETTRWITRFRFADFDAAASHIFTSLQQQRVILERWICELPPSHYPLEGFG